MSASSYPLAWPEGWKRTHEDDRINTNRFNTTFDRARKQLQIELERLGAENVVISSWIPLRQDGNPRSDAARRRMDDPGVAVYFTLRKQQMVMARDAFWTVHDNLRSIGLSIEGLRQMERHGGASMMERAFEGFLAIEPPKSWRKTLGFAEDVSPLLPRVEEAYRRLARDAHPDKPGGSETRMADLNVAITAARKELT